jgi:hypothetical protein
LNDFAWICVGVSLWVVDEQVFSSCFPFSCILLNIILLRCSLLARHLAANSGTRASVPLYVSSLHVVGDSQLGRGGGKEGGGVSLGAFCDFHFPQKVVS